MASSKWLINKAVRESPTLAPPARLIMLVLSDLADAKTCVIPEEHVPSLREISEMTGHSKGTVTKHLNDLEELGWVERDRPTLEAARRDHERTGYQLAIGSNPEPGMSSRKTSHVLEEDMLGGGACPANGQEHVLEEDMGMSSRKTVPFLLDHYQTNTTMPAKPPAPKKRATKPKPDIDPALQADIDQICEHLADWIEANGSKRPTITKTWRAEARLLLDRDGRTVTQVLKAIDWCQKDPFWRSNILSMAKLRAKYDQLRLAAQRPNGRASPRNELTEVNGMRLKQSNVELAELAERMRKLDAANEQHAIGGNQ